ncbi:MAG: DUF1761 domain-containing protein [Candidatus Micrarchaeaceae archaeon]
MLTLAINWTAVLISAVAAMLVGALWYSPILFGKPWMKEVDKEMRDIKQGSVKKLVASFVTVLAAAVVLDIFIKALDATTIGGGILVSFIAWLGFRETRHWLAMTFETSTMRHFLINSGHDLVEFIVMGAILGLLG